MLTRKTTTGRRVQGFGNQKVEPRRVMESAQVLEVVGSPGWTRTSDILINRRGAVTSRPSRLLEHLRGTDLFAWAFVRWSSRQKGSLATGANTSSQRFAGSFSANQRKGIDVCELLIFRQDVPIAEALLPSDGVGPTPNVAPG